MKRYPSFPFYVTCQPIKASQGYETREKSWAIKTVVEIVSSQRDSECVTLKNGANFLGTARSSFFASFVTHFSRTNQGGRDPSAVSSQGGRNCDASSHLHFSPWERPPPLTHAFAFVRIFCVTGPAGVCLLESYERTFGEPKKGRRAFALLCQVLSLSLSFMSLSHVSVSQVACDVQKRLQKFPQETRFKRRQSERSCFCQSHHKRT